MLFLDIAKELEKTHRHTHVPQYGCDCTNKSSLRGLLKWSSNLYMKINEEKTGTASSIKLTVSLPSFLQFSWR